MTKRLELLANIIKEDNYEKLRDQKIPLLFDSARKWSKKYQELIAYTLKGLYLIFLEQTQDNKVNSISPLIIQAIEKFKKYNTTIVAICTDNDNTNKKTFNPDKGIIQKLSNDYFISQPYTAHAGELAINDLFGKGCEYEYITNNIQILLSHVQSAYLKKNGEPHLKTIRWDSPYKCVKLITEDKKSFFENSDNIEKNQSFDENEKKVTWDNLQKNIRNYVAFYTIH